MSSSPPRDVAIIGAGPAGMGVIDRLRDTDATLEVFEKSGGVCGRAASRRRDGCIYDHGANYITVADERTADLIDRLGTHDAGAIEAPVWVYGEDGRPSAGDPPAGVHWTYADGITQFAKRVLADADVQVHRRMRIDRLAPASTSWELIATDGTRHGPFRWVVLTPPAPQTADLLKASDGPEAIDPAALAIDSVPYRSVHTVALHYPFSSEFPWYAVVDPDHTRPVGWLSREECKPGRVPDGESLWIAQLGAGYSRRHAETSDAQIAEAVSEMIAQTVDDDRYRLPDWTDHQWWRYALPEDAVDAGVHGPLSDARLRVAGDWVTGVGRVPAAFWNGYEQAAAIAEDLAN